MPPPGKAYGDPAWAVWWTKRLNPTSLWQPQAFILSSLQKTQATFWNCLVRKAVFCQAAVGKRFCYLLFIPLKKQAKRLRWRVMGQKSPGQKSPGQWWNMQGDVTQIKNAQNSERIFLFETKIPYFLNASSKQKKCSKDCITETLDTITHQKKKKREQLYAHRKKGRNLEIPESSFLSWNG